MVRVGKFEKVSLEQFKKDWIDTFGAYEFDEGSYVDIYNSIKLPSRATSGSAGYDFYMPVGYKIFAKEKESLKIPTGIRVFIEDGWTLKCYPKSGLGFKYKLQLNNTVGIIDSDYYYSDNEGHIFAKIYNDNNEGKELILNQGDGFMQGIFEQYGITYDDNANGIRNGGFGSTSKVK
jgi:dUTP pyrophosphatase